jgi:TRAP-type uncharacterized transport system fused permease subunit
MHTTSRRFNQHSTGICDQVSVGIVLFILVFFLIISNMFSLFLVLNETICLLCLMNRAEKKKDLLFLVYYFMINEIIWTIYIEICCENKSWSLFLNFDSITFPFSFRRGHSFVHFNHNKHFVSLRTHISPLHTDIPILDKLHSIVSFDTIQKKALETYGVFLSITGITSMIVYVRIFFYVFLQKRSLVHVSISQHEIFK